MGKKENDKNIKLSHKYDSHMNNLINKFPFPSKGWTAESKKAKRAKNRFFAFVDKSIKKSMRA